MWKIKISFFLSFSQARWAVSARMWWLIRRWHSVDGKENKNIRIISIDKTTANQTEISQMAQEPRRMGKKPQKPRVRNVTDVANAFAIDFALSFKC